MDIVILGAGISGISLAHYLQEKTYKKNYNFGKGKKDLAVY